MKPATGNQGQTDKILNQTVPSGVGPPGNMLPQQQSSQQVASHSVTPTRVHGLIQSPHPQQQHHLIHGPVSGYPVAAPRNSRNQAIPSQGMQHPPFANQARQFMNFPGASPAKARIHQQTLNQYYPNLSGSETDVSTSTENLTQEERFLLRHMEREEPQGEETGDAIASLGHLNRSAVGMTPAEAQQLSAAIAHRQQQLAMGATGSVPRLGTPTANPTYANTMMTDSIINAGVLNNSQDELWAAKIAAVSRAAGSPIVTNAFIKNNKLNPSVYSHPVVSDPLLQTSTTLPAGAQSLGSNPPKNYPMPILNGKRGQVVDMTSSGAFFDPKAVTKSSKDITKSSDNIIAHLAREMKIQQLRDESERGSSKNMSEIGSNSSGVGGSGDIYPLNGSKTNLASGQSSKNVSNTTLASSTAVATSSSAATSTSSGYKSNSNASLADSSLIPNNQPGNQSVHADFSNSPRLTHAEEQQIKYLQQQMRNSHLEEKKTPVNLAVLSRSQPDLLNEDPSNINIHQKAEASTYGQTNTNFAKVIDDLRRENIELRREFEENSRRNAKVTLLEEEMSKIHQAYQNLLKHSEKRENLEKAARQKLQNAIVNLTEVNKEISERHEAVMMQLMSGDPKNQNIPGLDAILRGEIMRKDALINQLMNQNKMLMSAKERQDIEMIAQQETLEEQRAHIQILDNALASSQAQLLEENRLKESYAERVKQMTRSLEQLQTASEKREAMEKKLRAKLEEELVEYREAMEKEGSGNRSRDDEVSLETLEFLKRKLSEAEEKIIRLESERTQWEQRYLEESAMRQVAIDAASIPKDAKIAALEKNSAESEKIIAEERSAKMKQFEEMQNSQRKIADMENHIKTLETDLAEQTAMVQILQSRVQGVTVSGGFYGHHHPYSLSSSNLPQSLSVVMNQTSLHGRQMSHLGTSASSASTLPSALHTKQLSTPVSMMMVSKGGLRSPGLSITQTDILRGSAAESATLPGALILSSPNVNKLSGKSVHTPLHLTPRELLRSATPTADLMRSGTSVSMDANAVLAGRRDSAPGDVLSMSVMRNRNASGSTIINTSDLYKTNLPSSSSSGVSVSHSAASAAGSIPKISIASLRDSEINKSTSKYTGNLSVLDDSIGSFLGPLQSTAIDGNPGNRSDIKGFDGNQDSYMEVWRI